MKSLYSHSNLGKIVQNGWLKKHHDMGGMEVLGGVTCQAFELESESLLKLLWSFSIRVYFGAVA